MQGLIVTKTCAIVSQNKNNNNNKIACSHIVRNRFCIIPIIPSANDEIIN